MQTHYTNLGGPDMQDELNTVYMNWALIMSFGSFVGAWALGQSADTMVGYFDIVGSDEFTTFIASMTSTVT